MFSLDTNVLVYAVDKAARERHETARRIVDRAPIADAALTEQSLFEFFHACTRKNKVPVPEATSLIRDFAEDFTILFPHRTVIDDAFLLKAHYPLSIWDARLIAVCNAHGCDHLLSEDLQDGAQYGRVTVVNPFNHANAPLIGSLLS
jgi:predicted nucleic acid-binding protein